MCYGREEQQEENRGCDEEVWELLHGPVSHEPNIPVMRLNVGVDERETIKAPRRLHGGRGMRTKGEITRKLVICQGKRWDNGQKNAEKSGASIDLIPSSEKQYMS